MRNSLNRDLWLGRIGLGLIFCYCFWASIFGAYFAQMHLTFVFLPFPIFLGEILLFICLVIFLGISKDAKLFDQRSVLLLSLYFGWVLLKAMINYHYDGPLTCRNAALFYYPIFAVFAYCFYIKAKISSKVLMSLVFLAAGILFFKVMVVWCWWTYVTLFIIAVWNTKSVRLRWLGWLFLAAIFCLGKEYIYEGPRAHFVSVFGAVVFLISYFGALLAKHRDYFRLSILFFILLSFILGFFVFSDRNDISSITSLKELVSTYQAFDRDYQASQAGFVPKKLSVHLYNPKKLKTPIISLPCPSSQPAVPALVAPQPSVPALTASQPAVVALARSQGTVSGYEVPAVLQHTGKEKHLRCLVMPHWLKNIQRSKIRDGGRALDLNENNIVFRLYVWRDMAREFIQEPKVWVWGFSFGHPQRSRSLEVLHWAESEWGRDGWITPHNSFFHIIYRSGILGLCLIGILFFMIGRMVRDFFNMNSIEGALLVGGLIYWLILSNFFIILEFPYNAIIIWTLFGITWAYRDGLKEKITK